MLNDYEGVLEDWQWETAVVCARRWGFRNADIQDVLQEVVLDILQFKFDASKSNGASKATALAAMLDHKVSKLRRKETRHLKRVQRLALLRQEASYTPPLSLQSEVRACTKALPPFDQKVCALLEKGWCMEEIGTKLHCSKDKVRSALDRIRSVFERKKLGPQPKAGPSTPASGADDDRPFLSDPHA